MRRKLIAGNWKMNGAKAANEALLRALLAAPQPACSVAVCAPTPYLDQCAGLLRNTWIGLGAQDVSQHKAGAYTGDVSASMLAEFGCRYAIVGHSERRAYQYESDHVVAAKTLAALEAGLTPIVCVGETGQERESGHTAEVVARQLDAVLAGLSEQQAAQIVVAYEPVWAIGTGKTATPEMAQEVHALIRARAAVKSASAAASLVILYGGSMNAGNAEKLLAMPDIDGGLIGGAALKADDFLTIVSAASR